MTFSRLLNLDLVGTAHYPTAKAAIARALACASPCLRVVELKCEPDNEFDANAIAVECQGRKIGYVAKKQAATLASTILAAGGAKGRIVSPKSLEISLLDGK